MTKVIKFTKIRYVMFLLSVLLIAGGIAGTVLNNGFNLGIDYQAGLNQRIQIAPVAVSVAYTGAGDVSLDIQNNTLSLELRNDSGVQSFSYNLADYPTMDALVAAMGEVGNIRAQVVALSSMPAERLTSGLSFPLEIGAEASYLNRTTSEEDSVSIEDVRAALDSLGSPLVQVVGRESLSEFIVRVGDPEGNRKEKLEAEIVSLLEASFGQDTAVVKQSDYVGPRFSSNLANQSFTLVMAALGLILVYIWFRFKLGFAVSAITALAHDVLIMLGFIGTFRLEVSTTTVAAVLTIIGYSLNDTIVVFDRIRENQVLLKGDKFDRIINTSITQSLSRTIITSLTTLLAVVALYVFGTGVIKDFAQNLIVGIVVGTYSSIFIASPVLLGWTNLAAKRKRGKAPASAAVLKEVKTETKEEDSAELKKKIEIQKAERKLKGKRKKKK